MTVSELIKKLQDLQAKHGDLNISSVAPEGPYTRCEGDPDILGIGYADDEGEYISIEEYQELAEQAEEAGEDISHISGPYICIGSESYE